MGIAENSSKDIDLVNVFKTLQNSCVEVESSFPKQENKVDIQRGTAFCIDTIGIYLTCAHVVCDKTTWLPSNSIKILHFFNKFFSSYSSRSVTVLSVDTANDFALLKNIEAPLTEIESLSLDSTETYSIGDVVCYSGCPYPILSNGSILETGIVYRRGIISGYLWDTPIPTLISKPIMCFVLDGNGDDGLSGSPVVLAKTHKVIGIIERPAFKERNSITCVIPIKYAYPMLKDNKIANTKE